MSKFVLEKAVEKTRFVIEKKQVKDIKAHVVVDFDVSGSTQNLYRSGTFQKAFQQVLPIGILFDDNQEVDVFTFGSTGNCTHLEVNATAQNYENYIKTHILNANIPKWDGTDYAHVLQENINEFGFEREVVTESSGFLGLFKKKVTNKVLNKTSKTGYPVIVFFFTDGENTDQAETYSFLRECEENELNIYFQFIGIGNGSFDFLNRIAADFNNTGFVHMKEFDKMVDDDDFINLLLSDELCEYLKTK